MEQCIGAPLAARQGLLAQILLAINRGQLIKLFIVMLCCRTNRLLGARRNCARRHLASDHRRLQDLGR